MKEYCVDLEIAKKLKENGFPQNCNSIYVNIVEDFIEFHNREIFQSELDLGACAETVNDYPNFSAPATDEILKELPHEINGSWLIITPVGLGFEVGYWEHPWNKEETNCEIETQKIYEHYLDKKLSNALSNLWLHLKKEGLLNEVQRR